MFGTQSVAILGAITVGAFILLAGLATIDDFLLFFLSR